MAHAKDTLWLHLCTLMHAGARRCTLLHASHATCHANFKVPTSVPAYDRPEIQGRLDKYKAPVPSDQVRIQLAVPAQFPISLPMANRCTWSSPHRPWIPKASETLYASQTRFNDMLTDIPFRRRATSSGTSSSATATRGTYPLCHSQSRLQARTTRPPYHSPSKLISGVQHPSQHIRTCRRDDCLEEE